MGVSQGSFTLSLGTQEQVQTCVKLRMESDALLLSIFLSGPGGGGDHVSPGPLSLARWCSHATNAFLSMSLRSSAFRPERAVTLAAVALAPILIYALPPPGGK